MSADFYLGNPNLKKVGTEIQFTKHQIQEYLKCKEDPVYFARNYIKIISCLLYTSPSPRDLSTSRMPSSA